MSVDTNILGVTAYLSESHTTDTALGIYGSQIRLSETPLVHTDLYTAGLVVKVGSISLSSDFSTGGNTSQVKSVDITLLNANKYYQRLLEVGIELTGLMVQLREFVGSSIDSDAISSEYIFTGYVTDSAVDSTTITLTVKSSLSESRRANIGKLITIEAFPYAPEDNIDKIIPVMFGSSDPANGRYFKILQNVDKHIKYRSEDWFDTVEHAATYCNSPGAYEYPEIATEVYSNIVNIRGGEAAAGYTAYIKPGTWFTGKYLKCTVGKEKITGAIRKILAASVTGYDLAVTVQEYFEDVAVGNTNFNATDQTYFELYDREVKFLLSIYGVLGFYLSSDGITPSTDQPEIYAKVQGEIERVMSSSVDIDIVNNEINLNPRIYRGDILTALYNFSFIPPVNYGPMSFAEYIRQNGYGVQVGSPSGGYVPGLFTTMPGAVASHDAIEMGVDDVVDRDGASSAFYRWFLEDYTGDVIYAYAANPPKLPDNFKFKKCYLGLKASCPLQGIKFKVMYKKYMHPLTTAFDSAAPAGSTGIAIDNIPDFYYLTNTPSTGNKNFFTDFESTLNLTGYSQIDLEFTTAEEFNAIKAVGLYFYKVPGVSHHNVTVDINEVTFMFLNEQSIGNELYV